MEVTFEISVPGFFSQERTVEIPESSEGLEAYFFVHNDVLSQYSFHTKFELLDGEVQTQDGEETLSLNVQFSGKADGLAAPFPSKWADKDVSDMKTDLEKDIEVPSFKQTVGDQKFNGTLTQVPAQNTNLVGATSGSTSGSTSGGGTSGSTSTGATSGSTSTGQGTTGTTTTLPNQGVATGSGTNSPTPVPNDVSLAGNSAQSLPGNQPRPKDPTAADSPTGDSGSGSTADSSTTNNPTPVADPTPSPNDPDQAGTSDSADSGSSDPTPDANGPSASTGPNLTSNPNISGSNRTMNTGGVGRTVGGSFNDAKRPGRW
jgi:hypothetical protein